MKHTPFNPQIHAWATAILIAVICSALASAQELPEAPPAHRPTFTAVDWSIVGAEFAVRGLDYASTMDCQHATVTGLSLKTQAMVTSHTCFEYELPQSFVAGRAQFAFFSFGMALAQTAAQWELTRLGHRTMARRLALVSIGATGVTGITNKIRQ